MPQGGCQARKHCIHLPAQKILYRWRGAFVGHMNQVNLGLVFKVLHDQVRGQT